MNTVKFPLKLSSIEMVGNSEDTVKPGELISESGSPRAGPWHQYFTSFLQYFKVLKVANH